MCTTPKTSKAAKPKNRVSVTGPESYRNNLAAMRGASDHFDEFDRDEEQFRRFAQNKNKAKKRKPDSDDTSAKSSNDQNAPSESWMVQFREFWKRLF
ncbi:MAG TPA: hypothetical protein ENH92_05155 [Ectothiorhodospiraceae bacterium]|nr:hypothetical protein [Ectothiorhodospiraceae bacterium]